MHPLILLIASLTPALAAPQNGGGNGGSTFITVPSQTSSSTAAATTTSGLSIPGLKRQNTEAELEEILKILQNLSIPANLKARSPQTGSSPEISGAIVLRDGVEVKERQSETTPAPAAGNAALPSGLTAGEASSILAYLSSAHII
ncbi:hypothetical protein KEM54_003340 [Ascosphaera aggregata]|nr:hypothetical protein KEM54_003340 [Ascosphaera aggregata]